jgi:hypothetical protein
VNFSLWFLFALQAVALAWESWHDWRNPSRLSIPVALAPLAIGLAYGCLSGQPWATLAVALLAYLLLGLEFSQPWLPLLIGLIGMSLLGLAGFGFLAGSLLICYLCFRFNIIGEADGIALLAALLMAPVWEMAACLLLGLAIASAASLAVQYRAQGWILLQKSIARIFHGRMPTPQELSAEGSPMIWGVFLGFGIYALPNMIFSNPWK